MFVESFQLWARGDRGVWETESRQLETTRRRFASNLICLIFAEERVACGESVVTGNMIEKGELWYMEEREHGRGRDCNLEFVSWIPVSRSVEGNRGIGCAGGNR